MYVDKTVSKLLVSVMLWKLLWIVFLLNLVSLTVLNVFWVIFYVGKTILEWWLCHENRFNLCIRCSWLVWQIWINFESFSCYLYVDSTISKRLISLLLWKPFRLMSLVKLVNLRELNQFWAIYTLFVCQPNRFKITSLSMKNVSLSVHFWIIWMSTK